MYTTYILYSTSLDKFYKGYTSLHIHTRLQMHLFDHKGFTSKAKHWKVVHTEQFATKADAMQKEKQLKGWKSNIRIKDLIKRSPTQ